MSKPSNRRPREGAKPKTPLSIRSASDHSRARDLLSDDQKQELSRAVTVSERVELIFEWMVRGWYMRGHGDRLLAVPWGVDPATVRHYAAEANRRLVRELISKSRDELLVELLTRIANIGQDALDRTEEVALQSGQVVTIRRPDHRTALRAAEATGELLGLKVQRLHHTVGVEQLSTEQILQKLHAQGVKVEMPPTELETTGETITEPAGPAQGETDNA